MTNIGKPGAANVGRFHIPARSGSARSALTTTRRACMRRRWGDSCRPTRSGYDSGPNFYVYVRGDPGNLTDPLGLEDAWHRPYILPLEDEIIVSTNRLPLECRGSCCITRRRIGVGTANIRTPRIDGRRGGRTWRDWSAQATTEACTAPTTTPSSSNESKRLRRSGHWRGHGIVAHVGHRRADGVLRLW